MVTCTLRLHCLLAALCVAQAEVGWLVHEYRAHLLVGLTVKTSKEFDRLAGGKERKLMDPYRTDDSVECFARLGESGDGTLSFQAQTAPRLMQLVLQPLFRWLRLP